MRASLLLIILAACTPLPDDCDRRAMRELRVVDRLVDETRRNLARGYTYETVERRLRTGFVVCSGDRDFRFCTGTGDRDYRRPVAVDPAAEQRKLDSLRERRQALVTATASCRAG